MATWNSNKSAEILKKFISEQGYKRNSPDVNNPINIIPSGKITMKDVDFPVYGVDNLGNEKIMLPGNEYKFPGNMVVESKIDPGFFVMPDGPFSDIIGEYNKIKNYRGNGIGTFMNYQPQERDPLVAFLRDRKKGIIKPIESYNINPEIVDKIALIQHDRSNSKVIDKGFDIVPKNLKRPFDSYAFFEGVNNEGNLSGGFGVSNDKFGASVFGMTPYSKEDRKYFKGMLEPTLTYRPNQNLDINFSTEFQQNKTIPKIGLKYRFENGGEPIKPTLYVNPNDPEGVRMYNAYQDSLKLYNGYMDMYNIALNTNAGTREQVARRYNIQQDPTNSELFHLVGTNLTGGGSQYMWALNKNNVNPNILPIAARSYADESKARLSPFTAEYGKPVLPVEYERPKRPEVGRLKMRPMVKKPDYNLPPLSSEKFKDEPFRTSPRGQTVLQYNPETKRHEVKEVRTQEDAFWYDNHDGWIDNSQPVVYYNPETNKYSDKPFVFQYKGMDQKYKFQDGGEEKDPEPETMKQVTITPLSAYYSQYNEKNPFKDYLINEKYDYIRQGNKGLQNIFNITEKNFPEKAEQRIIDRYNYNRNNYVIEQYAKDNNIDLTDRESIMNNPANAKILSEAMANSKYGKFLQPSLWARTKAGAVSAANAFNNLRTGIPGPTFTPDIKGLTPAEEREYYYPNSTLQKIGNVFDVFSFADIPGAALMNQLTDNRDYAENPSTLGEIASGTLNARTSPMAAAVPSIVLTPAGILGAPDAISLGIKGLGKVNKVANDATDLLADGFTRLTTQTPLKNTYKLFPGTVKDAPFVPMYRTQKPGQTQEILEVLDLQKKANEVGYENLSITEKVKLAQLQSRPNIGQGFDTDLSKAHYYGHPNIRRTRGYDEIPEVLRAIVSRKEAELFNVKNFPQYAKQSRAHRTEHILPMDMIQQAEKFSFDDLARLREEESLLNPKPHWLRGYPKQLSGSSDNFIDFSKYLTQEEAVAARANRMLSQEGKWVGQNNELLRSKFENAVTKHNPASETVDPINLGVNSGEYTSVAKDAISNGKLLNDANKARIAAHETGHYYRNTPSEAIEWNSFFDFKNLEPRKQRYLKGKSGAEDVHSTLKPKNEGIDYVKNPPHANEIRERAAQLKDYIAQKNGIPLDKDFIVTEDMLDDAIKNYVKDTKLDNSMSAMLSSLIDKKGFLKAMNKYALTTTGAGVTLGTLKAASEYQKGGGVNELPKAQFGPNNPLTPFTGSNLEYERQYVKDNFGNPNREVADKVFAYMKLIEEADAKDAQRKEEAYLKKSVPVSDKTKTVVLQQAVEDINNAAISRAYMDEKNKQQQQFEKEVWQDYSKMSTGEKALDRLQAFMVDPYGMTARFITGNQSYYPGMGRGLLNHDNPNYENYLRAVGYTPGEIEPYDIGHIVNPMYWGASIGNNIGKGNYGTAALESALTFAPFLPKGTISMGNVSRGTRMLGNDFNQAVNTVLRPIDKVNPALRTITKAGSLNEALNTFYGIPTSKSLARLDPSTLNSYRRVQQIGRMADLRKPLSERVQYGLKHLDDDDFIKVFDRSKSEASDELAGMIEREKRVSNLGSINLTRQPRTRNTTYFDLTTEPSNRITGFNRVQYVDNLLEETRNLGNSLEQWRIANPIKNFNNPGKVRSSYPKFDGDVRQTVPSLFLNEAKSLKEVSKKIDGALNFASENLNSGEVFTGSMNTSHNSYLPQLKELFKYASNDGGSPVFLGYKPMNQYGYLSKYDFDSDNIVKYLNSELDLLQTKKGIIPKNILRPYINQKGEIMLPQYGIRKYQTGGETEGGATHTYNGVNYKLQDGEWFKFIDGQFMPLTEGNIQERYNILNKYAKKIKKGEAYLNDFLYTEDDLKYLNSYKGKDLCPSTGKCLQTAFMGYDAMLASRHSDFPSSFKLKQSLGFASVDDDNYWYDENTKTLIDKRTNKPVSDQTMKWFESKPFFNVTTNDFSVDSWDVHGQIVSKGGINIYTDTNSGGYMENSHFAKMSKEEKAKLYAKIPVGAIIGFGDGSRGRGLNGKYGLANSNHSAIVVGFTEEGVPVIYDFGKYTTIEDPKFDGFPITNISFPKEFEKKTKAGLEVLNKFSEPPTELNLNYEVFDKYGADMSELDTFYNTLKKSKIDLMNDLNITNSEYDMLAKLLLATAMQETTGGSTFEHNTFGTTFGETHGLTQMNIINILEDEQLAPIAAKYGITEASDLMDNEKAAYANMIYAKRNLNAARANYQKGLFKKGQTGIRTYYPRDDFDDRTRAKVMFANPVYDGYTYNTEEGPQVDFFTGVNYLGTGWDKSLEDIQSQFDEINSVDPDGNIVKNRYKVYEDQEGNKIVDKITYGNDPNLSDEKKFIYNWQSPTSLSTGDAQGGSRYMQQVYDFYSKIKREGGEIKIKPENKGKFTAWAEARNLTVKEAEDKVLANKEQYSPSIVKMANFSRNARGWKKEQGGSIIGEKTLDLNNLDSKYKKGGYTYKATNDIIEAKNLLSLLI